MAWASLNNMTKEKRWRGYFARNRLFG